MPDEAEIRDAILGLVRSRAAGKTVCPSEVARGLADDWRPLMDDVRRVAADLHDEGRLAVTQKGEAVDPRAATGPVRLGRV
ncbi:DUF3253 domain-containing protein [Tranquillimonas rosea]|uniref:DUF3253 domain-containing protein n=1 Tax=Tranquillimonas rosea TaxID=641238 RepID=UPI003BAC09D5